MYAILHKRTHRSTWSRSGPEAPRKAFAQRIDARGVSEITKRSQIVEQIRGVSKSMMRRKVVAARQAPLPNGTPSGLPRGEKDAGEKGTEIAKANPLG